MVLGAMLLLAAAANMICVSYDTDDDEDTPQVTIELNLAAPVKKNIQVSRAHKTPAQLHSQVEPSVPRLLALADRGPASPFNEVSPQLVVPLRR